jgi:hypothetical protein
MQVHFETYNVMLTIFFAKIGQALAVLAPGAGDAVHMLCMTTPNIGPRSVWGGMRCLIAFAHALVEKENVCGAD